MPTVVIERAGGERAAREGKHGAKLRRRFGTEFAGKFQASPVDGDGRHDIDVIRRVGKEIPTLLITL
jgi:hypothetical protein